LSRGDDALIVDPTPYGSLSTLTGNATPVTSEGLAESYRPSQGPCGRDTDSAWARKTTFGIAAARCDYADQFAKHKYGIPSDIERAERDYVLIEDGARGTAIVIDRAATGKATKELHLRFRTADELSLSGDVASGQSGSSSLQI